MNMYGMILIEIVALILQGFFSGSEIALMSADKLTLRRSANKGNAGARLAIDLLAHPDTFLSTTLIGTSLCVVFQATLFTLYIFHQYGPEYDLYGVLVLTPLTLIFGEIIPKTVFQRYSDHVTPLVAPLLKTAQLIFSPAIWILAKYTSRVSKFLEPIKTAFTGKRTSRRDELSYLLSYGKRETKLKTSERRMIRKIFDFTKAEAKRALIPLVKIDAIEDTCTQAEALDAFTKHQHSRLPVFHDRIDNIIGVIHVFDLFAETNPNKPITKIMQPAFFAPVSQQLDDLLYTMRKRGIQMSVIVDEYGGAVGLLTIEDILEEIVGDISDEFDEELQEYRQLNDKNYVIQAKMEIESLNEKLSLDLPKGNYETLAGFLLQQFNRIPEEGDELFFRNKKFVIRKCTAKSIEAVQITLLD